MDKDRGDEHRERCSTAHLVAGNRLTLLPEGSLRQEALFALVESAVRRIDLFFYIFDRDTVGLALIEALAAAARRGVAVTLLVDAFGSAYTPDAAFAPLAAAGGKIGRFGRRRSTRYLIRNHQKLLLVDGSRALIGGFNIAAVYFAAPDDRTGWRDLALQIEGPICGALQHWCAMLADWTLGDHQSFRALRRMVREWRPGTGSVRWLMGGPTLYLNSWARQVKRDLQNGRQLDLAAGYFSPGTGMLKRLCAIGQRGKARIILPMLTDNPVTIGAARHSYHRLLDAGIALGEYRPQKLHSKLLVIDDIGYVGSANFDRRSLFLNVELMLRVEDAAFADALRAEVTALAARSRHIDQKRYRLMASPLRRLRWWLDYLIASVLDYTVTRRLNLRRVRRN